MVRDSPKLWKDWLPQIPRICDQNSTLPVRVWLLSSISNLDGFWLEFRGPSEKTQKKELVSEMFTS